jgi:hypothetical protein
MPEGIRVPDDAVEPPWREIIGKHQSAMVDELSARLALDLDQAILTALNAERSQSSRVLAKACDEARRAHSESLNQALRRLRLATSENQTLQLLAETCAPWAERFIVLVFNSGRAHSAGGEELVFELAEAPAVTSAIEARDPLVTVISAGQLSPILAAALNRPEDHEDLSNEGPGKAWLFPLISRHAAVAMVVISGQIEPSPVELLCEAAAMRLESFAAPIPSPALAPAPRTAIVSARRATESPGWEDLSPEDQKLHLQAQRLARVRVAEIRLDEEDVLRRGLAASNVYGALESKIDAARKEYLQAFLSKSSTMVDYLHLEILRSLVKDDVKLLGAGYPGPMV